ncbi:proteoglycan 4-like isoform X2 [Carassius auratus]|nr:proteoglycan 4-like isoform X2 [Carassius auratus]XP_026060922.1 proteoglycan 4-like isoform X2 [Carassius auratus]
MSSSHCQRNPHRTLRTILEVPSELKPVSGDKASILHSKGTTVSQELNSAESHRPRTTKEEKQNALPDLSACLQKSRHQLIGPVFLKLHELELMVPQKRTTPKCRSETSNISRKGRKKKVFQPSEKVVAGRKACSDRLDHSQHNSCPEQHLRSQKTKGTRYRHYIKIQNSQTPSDVSTALHTCTTAPLLDKEISFCHTNSDCKFIPRPPKRGRPRTSPLFSSTPTSDFQPLSPKRAKNSFTQHRHQNANESSGVKTPPTDVTPSRPQRLVVTGRPRDRKKKNMEEQLIVSPSVKQSRKSAKSDLESPQEEPAVEPPSPNEAHITNQMPEPQESALHTCTTAPLLDKEISFCHTNGDCRFIPRTPKRGRPRTRPLFSSTPTSDFQPLSPKRAKNSFTQHRHQNANESSGVKTPPTDVTPSRPQRLVVTGRPRDRKKKNMEEQLIVSPSVKQSRKSAKSDLESPQEEPAVEPPSPNEAHITNQMPEPQESDQNMSSDLCIELSLQEKPHSLNHSLLVEEDDLDDDDEELPSFLQQDNKKPLSISEGLCVWCKLRKYPYWPAVVKSVNRKNKKASIVFIDCYLIDQKRIRKGFSVSLRKLKPFDCEERESLVDIAKEKYGNAITWSLELISDYRICIGCRSFSGSFIEYCSADISCPVRRRYSEGKSVLTFPTQEILGEQCDSSDNNMEGIIMEEQDELFSKKVLPDRSKAARNHANKQLVHFIISQKVENRLLAVISGRESSKWMQALQKPSRPVVNIYLEDEEQVEKVYRYLSTVCDSAPQIITCLENIQAERISLILDVLLPEAIIYAIAGVHKLSLEKAEEKYRRGPCFSNRERQEFDMMIEQQMKLKEITRHHVQ